MKPLDKLRAWKRCDAADRVVSCKALLVIHGFLTPGENRKVTKRIEAWLKKHGIEVER